MSAPVAVAPPAEPAEERELALEVEGLSKAFGAPAPRWHRILLPWSRVDSGGTDDDEDVEDEEEEEEERPVTHGITWALRDVSFSLRRGEIVVVVGAPGAGRRTLMRILAGVTTATSGRAAIHGWLAPPPSIGYQFVARERTPRKNILGLARYMRASRRLARKRTNDILEYAGVPTEPGAEPIQVRSEMGNNLAFATSIILKPDVLLAEEEIAPKGRKDPVGKQRAIDAVFALRDSGTAVLLRTDNLDLAEQMADRVLWLEEGRVRAFGPADELMPAYREDVRERAEAEVGQVEGPVHLATVVDRDGQTVETVQAGDDVRIAIDVELSALRTLVACSLELRDLGRGMARGTTEQRWRIEQEGFHRVMCTVPAAWFDGDRWSATLSVATDELNGLRRRAQQDVVVELQQAGPGLDRELGEAARWSLEPTTPPPSPADG